ncbi:MAG: hypothetical protein U0228_36200 [Myxococcaceae bacterium]
MRRVAFIGGLVLSSLSWFTGCVTAAPPPAPPSAPVDAGPTEAELLAPKLDALERDIARVSGAADERLWAWWITGAPLDLAAAFKGHEDLLGPRSMELLARAQLLRPDDAARVEALRHWIVGEVLVRSAATESDAIANLASTTSFQLDTKEVLLRDLGKLLVNEKSAVKRRALWNASHPAAARLDALIAARDLKLSQALGSLEGQDGGVDLLTASARARGFELATLTRDADETLTATEEEWKTVLQALSDVEVKLPLVQLTRGDLPRLLRVPSPVDAEFPKQKIATRLVQTVGALGLYGQPGLTLELNEAARKNPLPLTVAPTPGDVRVSVRPLGGLKDQQLALAELGTALWLHAQRNEPPWKGRLAPPLAAQTNAERFANLLSDRAWLEANEVKNVDAVIAAARAQRLFTLRRAAGLVLARVEASRAPDDTAARSAFVSVMSRALGVALSGDEGQRWRLETDDFLRSATQLEALRAAAGSPLAWPTTTDAGVTDAGVDAGATALPDAG